MSQIVFHAKIKFFCILDNQRKEERVLDHFYTKIKFGLVDKIPNQNGI